MKPFTIWNLDCIEGQFAHVDADSVGHCVTSIPFGALFTYSGKDADIGNNPDGFDLREGQFALHMRFFVEQLFRSMMPGRIAAIHIQQLVSTIVQHGHMGRRDFRGAVVDIFGAGGFEWTGEFVVPKNPQAIAQRQKLHSLQFKTGTSRDSCRLAPAVNDYVMLFRKPGENPEPVRCLYDRTKNKDGWVTTEEWIKWAHGLWSDIIETDVLEGWDGAREEGDEKHVCPLQLSVIQRCIRLYSNPGDLVMDPFMGIGSTAFVALGGKARDGVLRDPRRVIGFELKESYHRQAVRTCENLLASKGREKVASLSLFEEEGTENAA